MSKQVVWAKLRDGIFIPGGIGQISDGVLPTQKKVIPGLVMTLEDNGTLLLAWPEGKYTKSYTIAASNLISCLHAPEETK